MIPPRPSPLPGDDEESTMPITRTTRREFLAAAGALALTAPHGAFAQGPGTLNVLVPWPAGGPADYVARLLQPELRQLAQTAVMVENVPGAGGLVGVDRYVKKPAAERGLLLGSNSELIL